jgi:hypothetical protein
MKKKFIFVCQMEESGVVFAGRQGDVDAELKEFEDDNKDVPFSVIGKIEEPSFGLTIGFSEHLIEWYDKKEPPAKEVRDQAVLSIIELIR